MAYYSPEGARHEESFIAGRGHHESDWEFEQRLKAANDYDQRIKEERAKMNNPSEPTVALTVSIPVTIGGYTGQRDQWEQTTRQFAVTVGDDGQVILKESGGSFQTKVEFDRAGLEAALNVLSQYDSNAKPKPVMR
jgi:hypothetical protein